MTALMVIAPLYHFRDEDSTLHIAFDSGHGKLPGGGHVAAR